MTKSVTRDYHWRDNHAIGFRRKTGTAVSGAVTLRAVRSQITSESLTTAAAATYTLTITNSLITADSLVLASVQYGSSTTGTPTVCRVTPGAGQVVIVIQNVHASAALNGTIVVDALLIKNSANG